MTVAKLLQGVTTEVGRREFFGDNCVPGIDRNARSFGAYFDTRFLMFSSVMLLTGAAEAPVLAAVLRRHNPRLQIHSARSLAELEAIDPAILSDTRLIAFVTPVVVPARIIDCLGFGAYNFHPGPPQYPGWMPSHFAIYDRAANFGATVHVMTPRVDEGAIVAVEHFPVPPNASVQLLDALAFGQLARLFWRLANALATQGEALPAVPVRWRGRKSTRRLYAAMCEIAADISKAELDRRIEAFGHGHFGISPTISFHGHLFRYVPRDAGPSNEQDLRATPLQK